jgi:hypothetical protein
MAQPQYALANWWLSAIKEGRKKVGETFECRTTGNPVVTPEDLGCSTPGSIYNLHQVLVRAGFFTRAGDGYLAVSDLWEACSSAGDVISAIKTARPTYKKPEQSDHEEEPKPEPEPPALQFNLFDVFDQLNEQERITCALGLLQSLTTRAPDLERTIAELKAELDKREQEIQRLIDLHDIELKNLREELKTERANAMMLRQELESRRVSVARTIEKIITVDSGTKVPDGGQWSNAGSHKLGVASGPRVIMHRKPATGHVPRVVREHLHNGSSKTE